ncbi:hypothetical protein NL676_015359 [Syzygium grande]|nr:hypothetical protein NL676_015359 [Syzygium grande]
MDLPDLRPLLPDSRSEAEALARLHRLWRYSRDEALGCLGLVICLLLIPLEAAIFRATAGGHRLWGAVVGAEVDALEFQF